MQIEHAPLREPLPLAMRAQIARYRREQSRVATGVATEQPSILDVMDSPQWFGNAFATGDWTAWRAFLAGIFGLPMSAPMLDAWTRHTGRNAAPGGAAREAVMVVGRRGGKALALDTPIPTPSGWATQGDLRVGDWVFGADGKPTQVVAVTPVQHNRPCYRVEFSDGESVVADAEHEWVTQTVRERKNEARRWQNVRTNRGAWRRGDCSPKSRTTRELAATVTAGRRGDTNHSIVTCSSLELPSRELPIHPYVLGVWLGDGGNTEAAFTKPDQDIADRIQRCGYRVTRRHKTATEECPAWGILGLHHLLEKHGLLRNKHIPSEYLRGSVDQRRELLYGLMDTDGTASTDGKCCFDNSNESLARGVYELAVSLGFRAQWGGRQGKLNGKACKWSYRVWFTPDAPVFTLVRKAKRQRFDQHRAAARRRRYVTAVVPCCSVPVRCIQVANPDGMYLAGRAMVPTHNSRIAALIAVYLTCFRDYTQYLSAGEVGTVPIIAADRREARTVMRYVKGFLDMPALRGRVVKALAESVELRGRVQIEMHTASFRAVRGYTLIGAICDEIAFWDNGESAANPDHEVLAALEPGMASIPEALLCMLSSPYARAGVLWERYQKYYGQESDPVVVWQASTRDMNPGIPQEVIDAKYRDDPDAAAAEYGGEFRRDVEAFVSAEAIRDATMPGRTELGPVPGLHYQAFVDPSGGAVDSMTLAIAHAEKGIGVLDCVREVRPPFRPSGVVQEFATLLKTYRITTVSGDRYGGEWPREQFRACGIDYQTADKAKSDIYVEFLSALNSRKVQLLDHHVMLNQLKKLERHRGRGGRDIVDHPPKGHDDVINAAAGAIMMLVGAPQAVAPVLGTQTSYWRGAR